MRFSCVFHEEHTPSLCVNVKTGKFKCQGCGRGGGNIIQFEAHLHECALKQAVIKLFKAWIHPIISRSIYRDKWHLALKSCPSMLKYLAERHILPYAINKYCLGLDVERITIPVFNEFGLCVNAKKYLPNATARKLPKMISHTSATDKRRFGSPVMLYPLSALQPAADTPVFVCEGEIDCLSLLNLGLTAVTTTGGARNWPAQYSKQLKERDVVICYDNDAAGQAGQDMVVSHLRPLASSVRLLTVPPKRGKDVNDWITSNPKMRSAKAWLQVIEKITPTARNRLVQTTAEYTNCSLEQAASSKLINRLVAVECNISSIAEAPFAIPTKVRIHRTHACGDPICDAQMPAGLDYKDVLVPATGRPILFIIEKSDHAVKQYLKRLAHLHCTRCAYTVEFLEWETAELAYVTPAIDMAATATGGPIPQIRRCAFIVGCPIQLNRTYHFRGTTTNHPKDQTVVHIFGEAKSLQSNIEKFAVTPETKHNMKLFQLPKNMRPLAWLNAISDFQRSHVTRIHERAELHIAVDLTFHSVDSFRFSNELVRRGMLDTFILGDSSCGKGQVLEGLINYYGMGQMVSGENCSRAGLTIGCEKGIGNRTFVKLGAIPLNHGGLVAVDEMSSIPTSEIAALSRVRSEGIIEMDKIARQRTPGKVRYVWLSNPRDGKQLCEFRYGMDAIIGVVGAPEDIRRFDYIVLVANNEVPIEVINSIISIPLSEHYKFTQKAFRDLVMWAWSRQPEQIIFTNAATNSILKSSIELSRTYTSQIPIIQGENIRIKLAKISVAIAARMFSTNATFEHVVVHPYHVECAVQWLQWQYSKACFGYKQYSESPQNAKIITPNSIEAFEKAIATNGKLRKAVFRGLLEVDTIRADTIASYVGDMFTATSIVSAALSAECIYRDNIRNGYRKTPAFSYYLKQQLNSTKEFS